MVTRTPTIEYPSVMEMHVNARPSNAPTRPLLSRLIDPFDSIKLGITLIALILIYSALGSAVPTFRQFFELTEFAFFNHWVFLLLIVLFCLNLTVTTIRRIAFNVRNLGVLTVHTGLLMLCGGGVIYFGQKIEGDVWLDAPRIRLVSADRLKTDPQGAVVGSFVAVKGKQFETNIPMLGGRHTLEVTDVEHSGMTPAVRVKLVAQIGDQPPQEIELRQGGDVDARFAKLSDRLLLLLSPGRTTETFYDDTTPMLSIARDGHTEVFALNGLPYYNERFVQPADEQPITDTAGNVVRPGRMTPIPLVESWRMPLTLDDSNRAVSADWPFTVEIDGYLPYARLEDRAIPGGDQTMPLAHVQVTRGPDKADSWLAASVPARSMVELNNGERFEFAWLTGQTALPDMYTKPVQGEHVLEVWVKDRDIRRSYAVTPGMKIDVEGTDYSLTVEELRPSWPLMTAGFNNARTPIALVWVKSPKQEFQRSVLHRFPQLNQDRDRAGKKMSDTANLVDDNLALFYTDASVDHFMIAASESLAPVVVHTARGGKRTVSQLKNGEPFRAGELALTMLECIEKPRIVQSPQTVPVRQRRSLGDVRRTESLIRVKLAARDGSWTHRQWVPFSLYNNTTLMDRHEPTVVDSIPGGRPVQLIYGRYERSLPGRVTLERLQTDFYPGRQQPSGWASYFRYEDPTERRVVAAKAWLNNTARIGGWTLFQSQAAGDHESWTVLGVGNREGVMTMAWGCLLITLGMIYAWTVKPALVRRRRLAAAAMSAIGGDAATPDAAPNRGARTDAREPVGSALGLILAVFVGFAGAIARPAAVQAQSAASQPAAGSDAANDAMMKAHAGMAGFDAHGHAQPPADEATAQRAAESLAAIQSQIDVKRLGAIVLQHSWRYATVDSWARDAMKTIHGSKPLYGLDPVVAAMELMFNAPAYRAAPILFVKDKVLLADLTAFPVPITDDARMDLFRRGTVSLDFVRSPMVAARVRELAGETIKKKAMDRMLSAVNLFESLGWTFTVVPHPNGTHDTPWSSPASLADPRSRQDTGLNEKQSHDVLAVMQALERAWLARDASQINEHIGRLEQLMPTLAAAGIYPDSARRLAEVKYRRMDLMWWAWLVYIFTFFVSIFAVATRYRWVRNVGLVMLTAAIGIHTYDLGLRWYVIGRIPVANMYEAVVSSTLAGTALGLLLELFLRKRVFLLSSALLGFFALALPEILPDKVDNRLTTMMPILDDIMLRIHTVLIISSYAVITLAYGVANCYLFVSAIRHRQPLAQGTIGAQFGAIACLVLAKVGYFDHATSARFVTAFAAATAGGAMLAVGAAALLMRRRQVVLAGAGGGAVAMDEPVDDATLSQRTRTVLDEFDLSHRVLLYTSTISLFVGLVLGAVWADYSWGRPWGWDPKEVFALNTWLVYAILIHARFVTKHRALWTSVLSVVGFAVMQFNWWVVNFYIVGLHSYA